MYTARFDEQLCHDVSAVGGKALGLAEMTAAGLPVAPGFTVCTAAYRAYLEGSRLRAAIESALTGITPGHPDAALTAERTIAVALASAQIPSEVATAVTGEYEALCARVGVPDLSVAVRSSATAEDSAGASFAGEFETYVDISGADDVLAHVRRCWDSVFTGRALAYALDKGLSPLDIEMAVVVQKTVRARAAGVMFTLSPVTGDRSRIVLEASWGLGLSVVGGEVTPDRYTVDKIRLSVCERVPGDKRLEYRRGDAPVPVPEDRWSQLCLSDEQVIGLARLGKSLERLQKCPQDIEFAVDDDLPPGAEVVLLQCRPETIWSARARKPAFDPTAGVLSMVTASVSGRTERRETPTDGGHRHG
ncbi:PEP/pyruvate-binding domain-containing protein [Geodermatophilus sp. SYSU D00965]